MIDINNQLNCEIIKFPDGQPHIKINPNFNTVNCSIKSPEDLFLLMLCADCMDRVGTKKQHLHIPYLMGARYDRPMYASDSFDLKIIADMINYCGFESVFLYDVHSYMSNALIKNSLNVGNDGLVRAYKKEDSILICPDAGAVKKIDRYLMLNWNIKDVVYCIKKRDEKGDVKLKVLESEKCEGKNTVIIDDICDGGATFLAIAEQIKPLSLTLIVTHAIFSKGINIFRDKFNEIITTDSYKEHKDPLITTIKL